MSTIFLSYRRGDTAGHAGRLVDRLRSAIPGARVFMDVDTIEPGVDFVAAIEESVASSDAVLALIGDDWLTVADGQGNRRLDNPEDFVRLELTAALKRKVPVIPVLVERARMPASAELPPELSQLARINSLEITDDRWDYDVGRLVSKLESLGMKPQPPAPAAPAVQGEVGRRCKGMARSGQPRRLALVIGLAVAILGGILVAGGRGDDADAPQDAAAPLLVDVRTNIDDFDYSGIAHVPEFFTSRPISEVGPPPNVRLERAGEGLADTNRIGRWTWARQLGAVDAGGTLLRVTLQGRGDAPVIVQGLSVEVTDRKPAPRGTNLSYTGLGAAVSPDTVMVDLDRDIPTITYVDESRKEQRSFTFSVSQTDVQVLNIMAETAACDCSWIVKLRYTFAGEPGEITLDDDGKPFRTVATVNADHCYWTGSTWSCAKLR